MIFQTGSQGNLIIVGSISGTVTFGSNVLNSVGGSDGFIAKYSPSGVCVWAILLGGAGADRVNSIAVESNGDIFACGFYEGNAVFGSFSVTNAGGSSKDIFVTKLTPAGQVLWVQRGGGSHANGDFSNGIALDALGNCYVAGTFNGGSSPGSTAIFGGTTLTNRGSTDIFIAKYNSSGALLWAKQAGGSGSDSGNAICASPSGGLYVGGSFQSSAIFGNTFAATNLVAGGGNSFDGFLAKYTSAGALDWVVAIGAGFSDYVYGVAPADSGGVFVRGAYSTTNILRKYTASGNLEWERAITNGTVTAIVSDLPGNLLVTGRFTNAVNLIGMNLAGAATGDIFLAKYDATGTLVWAFACGSVPYGQVQAVTADASETVHVTGYFSATATFGGSIMTSGADADVFGARLGITLPPLPSVLALQMYPGISITGIVGRSYRIEASDVLNTNWQTLTNLVLPSSPYLWFDITSDRPATRFYRAVVFVP